MTIPANMSRRPGVRFPASFLFAVILIAFAGLLSAASVEAQSTDATKPAERVESTYLNEWSAVRGLQLRPPYSLLKVRQSMELTIRFCIAAPADGELAPLGFDCDPGPDDLNPILPGSPKWSVNGVVGGSDIVGTIAPNGYNAIYTAPEARPANPTVAVSAEIVENEPSKTLLVSNVTILEDKTMYVGDFSVKSPASRSDVNYTIVGTFALEQVEQSFTQYVATAGVMEISYQVKECAPYRQMHPVTAVELYLDTPAEGQHWMTMGLETIELLCNGVKLGAAVSLHPCEPGAGGSGQVSLTGRTECDDGTYTWKLLRQ